MMKKAMASLLISLLLVLPLINGAFAQEVGSGTSVATVSFIAGDIEFDDPKGEGGGKLKNMDLPFGTHIIPTGPSTYSALEGSYVLRISDLRKTAGSWEVTCKMSQFYNNADPDAATKDFAGKVTLGTPGITTGPTSSGAVLESEAGAQSIMKAAAVARGSHEATWAVTAAHVATPSSSLITLDINQAAADVIDDEEAYTATITWTLGLT